MKDEYFPQSYQYSSPTEIEGGAWRRLNLGESNEEARKEIQCGGGED
jgi:hypothetical protein